MKIRAVEIQLYADGRWGFDDYSSGERIRVRCKTKRKALSRATDASVLYANGRPDLAAIDPARLQRLLKLEATIEGSPMLCDACAEFIKLKGKKSTDYVQCLRDNLALFQAFIGATRLLGSIKALEIQRFLDSRQVGERRKHNLLSSVRSLFRWASRMSLLDPDRRTEAEKVDPIPVEPGEIHVLTPEQMRILIANVREKFLPWLLIGGFAGIRSGEIAPCRQSKKSPLQWEDFQWKRRVIVIRRETSKKRKMRIVPILPNLAEWLSPWRNATGPVITCRVLPSRRETTRLGKLIGGWKNNCLRDSYCSYRSALTMNIGQVSMEMGNSPAMVERSYHEQQLKPHAREWFKIRPVKQTNVVAFRKAA